jgi:hypothetical protein
MTTVSVTDLVAVNCCGLGVRPAVARVAMFGAAHQEIRWSMRGDGHAIE